MTAASEGLLQCGCCSSGRASHRISYQLTLHGAVLRFTCKNGVRLLTHQSVCPSQQAYSLLTHMALP